MTRLVCAKKYADFVTADVSKASAKVQDQLPGRGTQAKKEGEKWASEAGSKIDAAVSFTQAFSPKVLFADSNPARSTNLVPNSQRPRASSINTARMLPTPQ